MTQVFSKVCSLKKSRSSISFFISVKDGPRKWRSMTHGCKNLHVLYSFFTKPKHNSNIIWQSVEQHDDSSKVNHKWTRMAWCTPSLNTCKFISLHVWLDSFGIWLIVCNPRVKKASSFRQAAFRLVRKLQKSAIQNISNFNLKSSRTIYKTENCAENIGLKFNHWTRNKITFAKTMKIFNLMILFQLQR